jgi:HEAT repeat protein
MTRRDFLGFITPLIAILDEPRQKSPDRRKRPRRNGPTPEDGDRLRARLEEAPFSSGVRGKESGEDRRRRLAILEALEPFGDRKVEVLTDILRTSRSNPIRLGAAYALGEVRDPKAISALLDFACEEDSPGADSAAGMALGKIPDPAVMKAILAEIKRGPRPRLHGACNAMAWLAQREFVPQILPLLKDKRPVVQVRAIEALGSIGDTSALPVLKALLNNPKSDFVTRLKATNAIAQIEAAPRAGAPEKP